MPILIVDTMDSSMCSRATLASAAAAMLIGVTLAGPVYSQTSTDWRRIGSLVHDRAMAGPASGRVDRVWYSADGTKIGTETHSGRRYETEIGRAHV